MQRFRGRLVFKAHILRVSLNSRLESNKEDSKRENFRNTNTNTAIMHAPSQRRYFVPETGLVRRVTSFTEMCSGSEAVSYLRPIDSCFTQLKAQGPSRTCNESKEEEEVTSFRAAPPSLCRRPGQSKYTPTGAIVCTRNRVGSNQVVHTQQGWFGGVPAFVASPPPSVDAPGSPLVGGPANWGCSYFQSRRNTCVTGVPRLSETASYWDPTVGLCLGSYGGPGGWLFLMSEVPLYQT